jgi:hypothetical protein
MWTWKGHFQKNSFINTKIIMVGKSHGASNFLILTHCLIPLKNIEQPHKNPPIQITGTDLSNSVKQPIEIIPRPVQVFTQGLNDFNVRFWVQCEQVEIEPEACLLQINLQFLQ